MRASRNVMADARPASFGDPKARPVRPAPDPAEGAGPVRVLGMRLILTLMILSPTAPALADEPNNTGAAGTAAILTNAPNAPADGSFPADWFFGNPTQRATQDALVGKPMPPLELSSWIGKEVKLKNLKGKIVVLDFWATWCHPCLMAMPHNNALYETYHPKGVEMIGVCGSGRGEEKMGQVAESMKLQYPQARDAGGKSGQAWRVMWYPTYAVVDGKGIVRALGLKPQFVENVVQALMEEQSAKR